MVVPPSTTALVPSHFPRAEEEVEAMWRRNWRLLVLAGVGLTLLCVAQVPPEEPALLGPFFGTTDEEGTLLLDVPDLPGVMVELVALDLRSGDLLVGLELEVHLEPVPRVREIRGPHDIASLVVRDLTGKFELEIAPALQVSLALRAGKFVSLVSAGELFFRPPEQCPDGEYKLEISGEDQDVVQFHYWQCQEGRWVYQGWVRAPKVTQLPEEPQPGQWVALVREDPQGVTYTLFRAEEEEEPLELGRTVPVGEALPPGPCEPCQQFLVEEGNTRLLYHCEAPGKWELVQEWEWQPPAEEPEEPPPEEEEPEPDGGPAPD